MPLRLPQRLLFLLGTLWFATTSITVAAAQGDESVDEAFAARAASEFELWWRKVEAGIVDLHGGSTDGERAASERRSMVERMNAVAKYVGGTRAADILWKAAVFDVDPKLEGGVLALRTQPWLVRTAARAAIGSIPGDALSSWIAGKLKDGGKNETTSPRIAAIEVLATRGGEQARVELIGSLRRFNTPERIAALRTLREAFPGDGEAAVAVIPMTAIGEPNVRIAALCSLGALAGPLTDETRRDRPAWPEETFEARVVEACGTRLARDPIWQVRRAAMNALVMLRSRAAIPALIEGLEAEIPRAAKEGTQQLLFELEAALRTLTGQPIPWDRPDDWKTFWETKGQSFRLVAPDDPRVQGKRSGNDGYLKYFSLDVTSKRLLFIVDKSGSMLEPARLKGKYANMDVQAPKFDLVQKELEKVILSLPEDTTINVIFFNEEVDVWNIGKGNRPSMIQLTDRNKSNLVQYLRLVRPTGSTNVYDALDLALQMGGRGVYDKYYKTAFDTVYLLSDGAPTAGAVVDPDEILRRVRETNALRQITFHTITFGDVNNARFMQQLAEQSGGKHVHIE
ncbi:MAG: VWA domain-containing protein [Planctomycetes bacterium]|nr:VWA domain-containing protein [Planctomycetota bacterium]MCB9891581.1 VWA domain-containing protein [Planctomycetota bacterium]